MGAVAWAIRQRSVSHPRSSNRTCRSPASGSPTGFTARYTESKLTARGFPPKQLFADSPRALIRSRKPSHRELDLPVGKLTPVFDNRHVAALRILIENLARLKARRVQGQGKSLSEKTVIRQPAEVTQFERPVSNVSWPFQCWRPLV